MATGAELRENEIMLDVGAKLESASHSLQKIAMAKELNLSPEERANLALVGRLFYAVDSCSSRYKPGVVDENVGVIRTYFFRVLGKDGARVDREFLDGLYELMESGGTANSRFGSAELIRGSELLRTMSKQVLDDGGRARSES